MFKHYFELIKDVEIYPIISLIIFVAFFVGLTIWVISTKKTYVDKMKNMPLEEDKIVNPRG